MNHEPTYFYYNLKMISWLVSWLIFYDVSSRGDILRQTKNNKLKKNIKEKDLDEISHPDLRESREKNKFKQLK